LSEVSKTTTRIYALSCDDVAVEDETFTVEPKPAAGATAGEVEVWMATGVAGTLFCPELFMRMTTPMMTRMIIMTIIQIIVFFHFIIADFSLG
jgi:hypothetical protein